MKKKIQLWPYHILYVMLNHVSRVTGWKVSQCLVIKYLKSLTKVSKSWNIIHWESYFANFNKNLEFVILSALHGTLAMPRTILHKCEKFRKYGSEVIRYVYHFNSF